MCQCVCASELIDLSIIAKIESTNNVLAYNKTSGAVGLYQITSIVLKDYNIINKTNYTKQDLFNPSINKNIALWYINKRIPQILKSKNIPLTKENILIAYNCGHSCIGKPLKKETSQYILKYSQYERN